MDGFELVEKLRRYYEDLPVLMLTAKAGLPDKAKGFRLGVDDYMTKPFEGEELLMRVGALLRRYKIESSKILTIGKLTVDKNSMTCNGDTIPLKEFELLFKLAGFPGKTCPRDQLTKDLKKEGA